MRFYKAHLVFCASLAACSSPRYTYYFSQPAAPPIVSEPVTVSMISEPALNTFPGGNTVNAEWHPTQSVQPKGNQNRRVAAVRGPVVAAPPKTKTIPAPAASADPDKAGKLGLIFFAAGGVVYLIGGPVFTVAGALSMIIGVIFGIKWLIRK